MPKIAEINAPGRQEGKEMKPLTKPVPPNGPGIWLPGPARPGPADDDAPSPLELIDMTSDPLSAALDQLAAHHEHLTALDAREARHFASISEQLTQLSAMITAIGRVLQDDTAALSRVEALEQAVTDLDARLASPDGDAAQRHLQPGPAWRTLSGPERQEAVARLRSWVKEVYRPGYGHLAVTLAPCWPAHDLCLYGLDILRQLWTALYLQPETPSAGLLSAQAEYQARILPAIVAQLMAETTGCGHERPRRPPAGYSRSTT